MKNKKKVLIIILLIPIYLLVFYYSLGKTNYSVTSPGGINKVEDKIKVNSDFKLSGSFNTTYVYSYDHISPLVKDYVSLLEYNEVDKLSTNSSLLSTKELNLYSSLSYKSALVNSLIVAFETAGLDISYGMDSVYVDYLYREFAKTNLEVGDLITKVNGKSFTSLEEFTNLVHEAKDKVIFTLDDGSEKYAQFVLRNGKNTLGLLVLANIEITDSEIEYEILKETGYGNSGGFIQTLQMYCILTEEDLTKGRLIAGTGAINLDGTIGPIGGIKEKIVTAVKNKVDIFLCPSVHYDEAKEVYDTLDTKMELVSVKSLQEAVDYLKNHD